MIKPIIVMIHGKKETITIETILKTRQLAVDNCHACIHELLNGISYNTEMKLADIFNHYLNDTKCYLNGDRDNSLWFIQKAWYIQTKESVPLFSK